MFIPALSLTTAGSALLVAQEGNPFAEWDRMQSQTVSRLEAAEAAAPPAEAVIDTSSLRPKSERLEYFSAGGATATLPPAATGKAPVLRERMATTGVPNSPARQEIKPAVQAVARARAAQPPRQPGSRPAADTQRAQQPVSAPDAGAGWPSSFQVHGDAASADPAAAVSSPPAMGDPTALIAPAAPQVSDVRSAGFRSSDDGTSAGIQQTSGEQPVTDSDLDAFLQQYAAPADAPTPSAPAPASNLTLSPEHAGPVGGTSQPAAPEAGIAVDIPTVANGPQSPGVTLQWVSKGDLNVGQECPIELVVQNTSQSPVRSVYVEAVIPANLQVLSSYPEPSPGTSAPGWTFGVLQPGEKRTVQMLTVPQNRGDLRLDAFVRLTGYSTSAMVVQEPMIGVTLDGPEMGAVGQQLNYNITVANPGTGIASNVIVQAALPEGLEHRHGSLITMEVGTLNPGETQQVLLSLQAVRGGEQPLAVRVLAEGGLSERTNTTVVVAEPELDLLIDGPTESITGRVDNYDLVVVNRGRVDSANVRARYRVPEGFEFVAADRGGKFNDQDRTVEFFVGTLQPGASTKFQLSLKALSTGRQLHQAGVISEHGQVTMAQRQTMVDGTADLKLSVNAASSQVRTGEEVVFNIRIENTGSREAARVGLSCELPPELELIQASGPSEYIAENGVMVFRSVPQIDMGESIAISIKARARRDGAHNLRLRVASPSIPEPLIGEEVCHVVR